MSAKYFYKNIKNKKYYTNQKYIQYDDNYDNNNYININLVKWKICDFPYNNYEVCTHYGLVRHINLKQLKYKYDKKGNKYIRIHILFLNIKIRKYMKICKLIANTFYGKNCYDIIHIDNNIKNNNLHNLRYINKIDIIKNIYQTKEWRKTQKWYINGKYNECEKYQMKIINKITNMKCYKTNYRLNIFDYSFKEIIHPFKNNNNGFEWSETFDLYQKINNIKIYYNLKFICDKGGAQTRSLREIYHFIITQLNFLLNNTNDCDIRFINILDGDTCYKYIHNYINLLNNEKYKVIKNNIYIGDMYNFIKLIK